MGKIKILDYTCGLAVTLVELGLYSYYVRELLASLLLFSAVFFAMGLIVLIVVLAWDASKPRLKAAVLDFDSEGKPQISFSSS